MACSTCSRAGRWRHRAGKNEVDGVFGPFPGRSMALSARSRCGLNLIHVPCFAAGMGARCDRQREWCKAGFGAGDAIVVGVAAAAYGGSGQLRCRWDRCDWRSMRLVPALLDWVETPRDGRTAGPASSVARRRGSEAPGGARSAEASQLKRSGRTTATSGRGRSGWLAS
jgi:hypothetical protein